MKVIRLKTIKIALTVILLLVMLLPVSSQELVPFDANQSEVFDSAPPSNSNTELATFSGSGPHRAPPPQGGSGLGLGGAPVRDIFWLLPVLAISYGVRMGVKRRKE